MDEKKKGHGFLYTLFIIFGVLFAIGLVIKLFENIIPIKKELAQFVEKQESSTQAKQESKPPSSADDLREAKKALEEKTKDQPYGQIYIAEYYLARIVKNEKEYSEAQSLLEKIKGWKKKQEALNQKKIDEEKKEQRIIYAPLLERQFLDKGWDIYVKVQGKDLTILRIKWVLVSRPMVHQLSKDINLIQKWREMGFKKIIFTDGYRETWYLEL